MARFEKDLKAAGEAPLDLIEWISGLAEKAGEKEVDSHGAKVARVLSGLDRSEALGGAFSPAGLTSRQGK